MYPFSVSYYNRISSLVYFTEYCHRMVNEQNNTIYINAVPRWEKCMQGDPTPYIPPLLT